MKGEGAARLISSSMVARRLNLPPRELFGLLQEHGWIQRRGDRWQLTPKGEFEGGRYVKSDRYGTYVGWPASITEHRIFIASGELRRWSASALGYRLGLSARMTSLLLRDIGWTRPAVRGWALTARGEAVGGIQERDPDSGIPQVLWPPTVLGEAVLTGRLAQLYLPPIDDETEREPDLFAEARSATEAHCSIDGHRPNSLATWQICQWLYLSGIAHACHSRLPLLEDYYCDFYLPEAQVYIDVWGDESGSGELADNLARRRVCEDNGLALIELRSEDLAQLDSVLPRQLLRFDFAVD